MRSFVKFKSSFMSVEWTLRKKRKIPAEEMTPAVAETNEVWMEECGGGGGGEFCPSSGKCCKNHPDSETTHSCCPHGENAVCCPTKFGDGVARCCPEGYACGGDGSCRPNTPSLVHKLQNSQLRSFCLYD